MSGGAPTTVRFRLRERAEGLNLPPVDERDHVGDNDIPTFVATFSIRDIDISFEAPPTVSIDSRDDVIVTAITSRDSTDPVVASVLDNIAGAESDLSETLEAFFRRYEVAEPIFDELDVVARRLVSLARWRFGRLGPEPPLVECSYSVCVEGHDWIEIRPLSRISLVEQDVRYLNRADLWELQELVDQDQLHEPLARTLLLKAVALLHSHPEASLVLAVAAVEVAAKSLPGRIGREDESSLLMELQAPPVWRLLRDYLPRVTDRRTADGGAVPKSLVDAVRKASEARNALVHVGVMTDTTRAFLEEFLVVASDILYLCDWFAGLDWALEHVTVEDQYSTS